MEKQKAIRVGIIRCDTHGMYYGALMGKHDPLVLRGPLLLKNGKMKHSWQNGGTHFYFYTHYADPKKMTVPNVNGFEITKVWDEDSEVAKIFSSVFYSKPKVCNTFEGVSDDVDLVFIADCNGDGSDHLKLVTPGLKKGIPTFVDKPFAYDVKDAQAIIKLAKQYKTPVMSLSILRKVPQFTLFRNRFKELVKPEFGTIKGGGETMAGHIHAISLAQHLFGDGVESVECMGQTPLAYLHLNYGSKPNKPTAGVVLNCASGGAYHCTFYASAYSQWGAIHSPGIGDFEFPYGAINILNMIKRMVESHKPQASYDEMIECIAIATAARLSQRKGKRVYLKDVL